MTCALCGGGHPSRMRCAEGHFVCDACHGSSAKEVIERHCRHTASTDPIDIAVTLMRHPAVQLHGPEHHFLVPAALLAAWCNAVGHPERKAPLLAEARLRSDPLGGGFCGYQGACGAAIGVGIFISLATGATPMSSEPWRLANQATAGSLSLVASVGGPRCCKRESWLVILEGVRFARQHLGVELSAHGPACEFKELNPDCIELGCPFWREVRA